MLHFEARHQPVLPRGAFLRRLARNFLLGLLLIGASLLAGMVGYHATEGMPWLDAFLNAAMLLGGMGPVAPVVTPGGKLFAGLYALYCGLAVVMVAGITFSPVVHRIYHRFHLATDDAAGD